MLDTAPLMRIRRTHPVHGYASVGQHDPPILRRHRMGQRSHVRLQEHPVLLESQHPILQQPAIRAAQLPNVQSMRLLFENPHTVRVDSSAAYA